MPSTTPACRRATRASPDRGRVDGLEEAAAGRVQLPRPLQRRQAGTVRRAAVPGRPTIRRSSAAFRTPEPAQRGERAPYMHAGQFATLEQVVQHYAASPKAVLGHSELARAGDKHAHRQPIRLSPADIRDLAAFLGTLTGPVVQPGDAAPARGRSRGPSSAGPRAAGRTSSAPSWRGGPNPRIPPRGPRPRASRPA